jgi:hypothetical protein
MVDIHFAFGIYFEHCMGYCCIVDIHSAIGIYFAGYKEYVVIAVQAGVAVQAAGYQLSIFLI